MKERVIVILEIMLFLYVILTPYLLLILFFPIIINVQHFLLHCSETHARKAYGKEGASHNITHPNSTARVDATVVETA